MFMKMLTTTLLALFTIVSFQNVAYAATSEVSWTDYKKYRDIRPSNNGGRKHFRESTFKNFEKHFTKLAESLPEGQVLKVDVTDVDLAGDTNAGGINNMRIVKDIYFPRMNFSYQLVNADGNFSDMEKRFERMGEQIEEKVEAKAAMIEKKADALCGTFQQLADQEDSLQKSIPALVNYDVFVPGHSAE